jgi:hypothetical protein
MHRCSLVLLTVLLPAMAAAEQHAAITLAPVHYSGAAVDGSGLRADLEYRAQADGFNLQATLRREAADDQPDASRGVVNQIYYDGQWSPSFAWTIGRKALPWGVGFGFKPLDVVQREDRRAANPPPLVGVNVIAVEHFTADSAWTLAWSHPGAGRDADPGLALHGYRLIDGDDLHTVLRLSSQRRLEAGAGMTRIIGEQWSLHGAVLYQQRGGTMAAAAADAIKAVAGVQWTGDAGLGILAEAWHDPEAPLVRHAPANNLLLRVTYDDRDGFAPYAELLVTPTDGGGVLTVGAAWQGDRQRLTLGLRQTGGRSGAAYSAAPIRRTIWAEWHLAIF